MASVLDLRRRIRSVKNTRQITKAMKMVSAAKLRRAQEAALQARPYAQMITAVLESLQRRADIHDGNGDVLHPLLVQREEKNVLVVVVAGDKGFAGAFNSNIVRAASNFIRERAARGQNVDVEPVGRKAKDAFRRLYPQAVYERTTEKYDNELSTHHEIIRHRKAQVELTGEHELVLARLDLTSVHAMVHEIIARFERAEIDSVYVVFNEFKSVIAQRVVVEKLLPIAKLGESEITASEEMTQEQREAAAHAAATAGVSTLEPEETAIEREAKKFGTADVDYIFDQSPAHIFKHLMPKYVETQILHAMFESAAAEHAARMTAMDNATSNAGEMIDALSLTMNRARQAAITKELIEIVSGAAAL
ncbi:F0F1 ATP synthase subunit gamma [Terriglobus tenax]|uniref:F0F1 ATP synthase subunit gamma n=1 Tax=Terriglobus tenax TaxID=1111115 RepID=UPI0021E09436|nr:FoF1 ATP synthase subunit gamma [Terriglobus tenax]